MRRQGVIQRWDDGKGFGFIRPHDGGPDLFVHASACQLRQAQRPAPGVEVSFETERGRDGRAQAATVLPLHGWPTVDALPAGAVEQRRRNADEARAARPQRTAASRSERAQRGGPSLRVAGLSIAALLLVLIVATATHRLPGWIWAWHAAASLLCFALYAADKSAAQAGRWRTPESTLLTFGLIGGWPGAIAAHHLLRHKSVKPSFRAAFHLTVVVQLAALSWLAWKGLRI